VPAPLGCPPGLSLFRRAGAARAGRGLSLVGSVGLRAGKARPSGVPPNALPGSAERSRHV